MFLTLILLPTIVFGGLVTDAVRIYHSEGLISEAGELAMNAGLSYYNMELKDDYGLFVMEKTPEEMSSDLENYFINTIRASGLEGAENVSSMLDFKCSNFQAYGVDGSEIYQTEVEKQQILEYMKYRAPVCLGEELLNKLNLVKSAKQQTKAMEAQVEYAESMDELQESCEKVYDKLKKYAEWAEENTAVTVMSLNGAIKTAEDLLQDAAECYFLIDIIDCYDTKGSSASEGEIFGYMEDFNAQSESLAGCSDANVKEFIGVCLSCLYDKKTVAGMGGVPSPTGLEDVQKQIRNSYISNQGTINDYRTKLENRAKSSIQDAWSAMAGWYVKVCKAKENAKEAETLLGTLKTKLETVRTKHENWKGNVDALSEGEMKKSMQESLNSDSYSKLLDESKINAFDQKLQNNIQNLSRMKTCLEAVKICSMALTSSSGSAAAPQIQQKVKQFNFFPVSNEHALSESQNKATEFMSSYFVKEEIPAGCELSSIKEDVLFKDLAEICEEKEETEEGKEDKKKTDNLMDQSKIDQEETLSGLGDNGWPAGTLPSDVLSQTNADDSDDYVMSEGGTDKNGRKKAMSNAKSTISSTSNMLDSLSAILEEGIEDIYIMEYGMQMFSYYTVDKDDHGNSLSEVHSISDDDLTDNKLYKSEVEYMLWGQKDAQKNVQNTRLLLYGIRVLFNLVYTFSDKTVGTVARSMAIAMSFGQAYLVPVFEVILKVALAGAETALDVSDLMDGKPVVLIKKGSNSQIILPAFVRRTSGSSSDITLNYREYLTIFLLIRTFGSMEATTLARIADCIQLNTSQDITEKCYTMLSVKADVESRTTFMSKAAKLPDGGFGTALDDWYTITYQSVLGY